ncbi:MAG: DUF4136 domain-containing protein [Bacteroidota bacterium]|nr:DUF4136 domain-containing protein [Bacteroidota bacterium]MDP4213555.1 DUF4136 domain-containing protein [Bacteroidota bacterium]MDP4250983.1 DUF4136 domain-containing protein [Bacteroidota bacterium]
MKPFKKITGLAVLGLLILTVVSSCKKDPLSNLSNDDSRIYITNYDTAASFETYQTFSIEDSVNIILNDQSLGNQLNAYDSTVISQVSQMMKSRGYTLVPKTAKPDLAINVSRVTNTSTGIISYPDYWDGYGGFYDPYYWGYPGYDYYAPYIVGAYTIRDGGLEIDILDLKNAASLGNKIQAVWSGLARGEDVFNSANASAEVSTLFSQSPYLKSTN